MNLRKWLAMKGFFGGSNGGTGGGGSPSGEMTGIGADLYFVMEGMCVTYDELAAITTGDPIQQYMYRSGTIVVVRDEPPSYNDPDMSGYSDQENFFCINKTADKIWMSSGGFEWQEDFGLPCRGWIEKTDLDLLDYTNESNWGLYAVKKVSYPLVDGTLTDYTSDGEDVKIGFEGFPFLTTVNLPNATTLGLSTFGNCKSLISVNIPKVEALCGKVFSYCSKLKSVTMSAIKLIDGAAFKGCTSLTNITYEGTVAQWNAVVKSEDWNKDIPATEVVCTDGTVAL